MSVLYAPEVSRAAIIGQQERQARLARMTPPARYNQTAADEVAWERQICGRATPIKITAKEIIRVVSEYYGVLPIDIASARRTLKVLIPRQAVMYLARELTLMSLPQIGARLGGRDHTTVLHGIRKMQERINADFRIAEAVSNIRARLKDPDAVHV